MTPFTYSRAADAADAMKRIGTPGAKFLGGGTNLIDLMRETIERPTALIDVTGLSDTVTDTADGGLMIGAAVKNTALAADRRVRERYPMLTRAIVAGASAQIRNMATVAGNLLQRTRCTYFYDADGAACNKRNPGQGCDAIGGFHRYHAILGASKQCIATHPSDMTVALAALDAVVHVQSDEGARRIALSDFHMLPGAHPERETQLGEKELITAIELPPADVARNSTYRKVRDRSSYAFALISVAAALKVEDGIVAEARLALGGVAHKPWRAVAAEAALIGKPADAAAFTAAADAELASAAPLPLNAFKVELARRTIVAVLAGLSATPGAGR
ncbi:4-hydroxybenzoyl-CoA reductase subunit beta [Variibacter gotjawalensis]|uniref:4-hydroxybenzoyl-CoA reductase subunit beta n=1 Tax=Variibacter gotjawalensis TaxID=1333996 RepID=A0A0S3PUA5_9BRAD|nr:xanthine dehydrogenase family protein subunit M [Variibacter gotjawalensis]NIK49854.1 xanthine dehydrogenase YagS FAD-binding subunit [Variibacter gotjawalensis]RZS45853.1 xanthine dehydrogenase YagS FAD-binding subunit [Variibacter gotjawalensis]BAT59529.1 4-hydroxybenzoyl-CoA reductase subunit beta [Variibacter gotjawalensis]